MSDREELIHLVYEINKELLMGEAGWRMDKCADMIEVWAKAHYAPPPPDAEALRAALKEASDFVTGLLEGLHRYTIDEMTGMQDRWLALFSRPRAGNGERCRHDWVNLVDKPGYARCVKCGQEGSEFCWQPKPKPAPVESAEEVARDDETLEDIIAELDKLALPDKGDSTLLTVGIAKRAAIRAAKEGA